MFLYIDPGTGSMLFTILISVIGASIYSLRMLFIKLQLKISGGKAEVGQKKIPIAVFAESKRYYSVFEPILRRLDGHGTDILYITQSPDDPALTADFQNIRTECIENQNKLFTRLNYLSAEIVLSTTPGLDVYQWKRSPDVHYYIHIPHAASDITLYRMFGLDYYDAIMLSGEYQADSIRELEMLRGINKKELVQIGIPYMDEMAKRLEREGDAPEHRRTVLLAPSWGPSALFSIYGGKIIEVLLKTGYHVIIRPHPQSFTSEKEMIERLMRDYPESDKLEWNRDRDNFEVLRRSDILISDFSGVIFDFTLVYDKPVIYTDPKFDLGPYDAWWTDSPLWTTSALPRIGRELTESNMESLKEMIDECIEDPRYIHGRREVKAETWANFGCGADRAADFILTKYKELTNNGEA